MSDADVTGSGDYTQQARAALLAATRAEQNFAGWLATVLAHVANELGSSNAVTAGRPGSWEAALVQQLLKGTVGYDDESLPDYANQLR